MDGKNSPFGESRGLLNRSQVTGSGRLPSLKPVRDLTLNQSSSSSSTNRRTFVPNLNAKKDLNNTSKKSATNGDAIEVPSTVPKVKKSKIDTKSAGQFKKKSAHSDYVQSFSMFADGLGAGKKDKGASGRSFARSSGGGSKAMDIDDSPSVSREPEIVIHRKKEKNEHNYFVSDLKQGDLEPVQLGVRSAREVLEVVEPATVELEEEDDNFIDCLNETTDGDVTCCLIQIPDRLPELNEKLPEDSTSDLSSWSDGVIGKLQELDNGQVRLVLGGQHFGITSGSDVQHLQDLVLFESGDQPRLTKVGQMTKRMVCVPDLDQLLSQMFHSS